jgi:hypothetical protein
MCLRIRANEFAVLFVKTFGTFSASSRALACNLAAKTMIIK